MFKNYKLFQFFYEEKKADHNIFSSEPHSPHFLVRATSKFSSFPLIDMLSTMHINFLQIFKLFENPVFIIAVLSP